MMSTKVTYETDHIFLLWFNDVACPKFLFFMYFVVIYREKDVLE